jgi:hypothetical protein
MTVEGVDLDRRRSPSDWRSLIHARVGRLRASKPAAVRRQALVEIAELAVRALAQHDAEHRPPA